MTPNAYLPLYRKPALRLLGSMLALLLMLTGCATTSCLTNLKPWPDPSGTHINLQQCWDKSDQIRFYTTNQGSHIAPYDLIKHLEMPLSTDKFFSRKNFEKWRFLPLEQTDRDQDSDVDKDLPDWPLGLVINNTSSGKEAWRGKWLGATCAACHTAQVEYQTKKIRIDGAPTMADLNQFLWDLQASLSATYEDGLKNGDKFKRYAKNFPGEWNKALLERLGHVVTNGEMWHHRNDPPTPPGFARFDAVGLIFNQLIFSQTAWILVSGMSSDLLVYDSKAFSHGSQTSSRFSWRLLSCHRPRQPAGDNSIVTPDPGCVLQIEPCMSSHGVHSSNGRRTWG